MLFQINNISLSLNTQSEHSNSSMPWKCLSNKLRACFAVSCVHSLRPELFAVSIKLLSFKQCAEICPSFCSLFLLESIAVSSKTDNLLEMPSNSLLKCKSDSYTTGQRIYKKNICDCILKGDHKTLRNRWMIASLPEIFVE